MASAALVLLLALAAPTAVMARDADPRGRFVVGAPDRLPLAGDRRHARRYDRVESAVGAYADIDEVVDATWLRHEVQGYARRAAACGPRAPQPCGRDARRLGTGWVIRVVAGGHGELLWTSGHRAVRLAWRRRVTTPTGTMTVDEPPADFAAALLAEFPTDLDPAAAAGAPDPAWGEDEIDRRLYYAERALERGEALGDAAAAVRLHFARAALRAAEAAGSAGDAPSPAGAATWLGVRTRLVALRVRRAAARQSSLATPWCAATPPLPPPPQWP